MAGTAFAEIAVAPINNYSEVESMKLVDGSLSSLSSRIITVTPKEALDELLVLYPWDVSIARSIAICESGGNPNAHNFSHITRDDSWGLFQINLYGDLASKRPSPEWLKVPSNNVAYAYSLYKVNGWKDWSCAK